MTQLWEIAREACSLLPGPPGEEAVGRVVAISSLGDLSLVSNTGLLFGGLSEQAYAQKWVWRPQAANTTDTVRYSTAYAPGTGTITVDASYTDETATDENAVLSMFSPFEWRLAIQRAVKTTRFRDTTIIPVISGQPKHYIHELDWLENPSEVKGVGYSHCPVITRNRYLQKRNSVDSNGKLTPEFWEVSNNAATTPFATTDYRGQKWAYSLERSGGTDATLTQSASALQNGVAGRPVGETITAVVVCDPDTAGDVKLEIGTSTQGFLGASTGSGDGLQEITASFTLAATDTDILIVGTAQTNNAAQTILELYLCIGELTDAIRRDAYPVYPLRTDQYQFEQGGPLVIHNPIVGTPGQLHITTDRPHIGFNATRLTSGAADTDETDCPLTTAAVGTIYYLFRGKLGSDHPATREWERKFDQLRASHLATKTDGPGFSLMGNPLTHSARSIR